MLYFEHDDDGPIVEIPLLTAITFTVTAAIIYPLKKIPYVNKMTG